MTTKLWPNPKLCPERCRYASPPEPRLSKKTGRLLKERKPRCHCPVCHGTMHGKFVKPKQLGLGFEEETKTETVTATSVSPAEIAAYIEALKR